MVGVSGHGLDDGGSGGVGDVDPAVARPGRHQDRVASGVVQEEDVANSPVVNGQLLLSSTVQ